MSKEQLPSCKYFPEAIAPLFDPATIRSRCQNIFDAVSADRSNYFILKSENLPKVVEYVVNECRLNYPDGRIPIHGRMRHFEMDGIDRIGNLKKKLAKSSLEKSVALADLVVVSVLLDAGAGTQWKFKETATGKTYGRSEGLAAASLEYFVKGGFANDRKTPRVDAERLIHLTLEDLAGCLQSKPGNEVIGLEGRLSLLKNLGRALIAASEVYGKDEPRPGNIVRFLKSQSVGNKIEAAQILHTLLGTLSAIWPGRIQREGFSLGDVWEHPSAGGQGATKGLVPFHKLSQWLSYSLVEPCLESETLVENLDALTGLPEYRNGGLFIDLGVLSPKSPEVFSRTYKPFDEFIVEWRALTVMLLDKLGAKVREKLHQSPNTLPLANILQGGTWSAGRRIANSLRKNGAPPIQLDSDGTVF